MNKFVLFSFLILGWVFFEMSGGTDFAPETADEAYARAVQEGLIVPEIEEDVLEPEVAVAAAPENDAEPEATRANNVMLASFAAPSPNITEAVATTVPVEEVAETLVAVTEDVATPIEAAPVDLREVAGSRVNMRDGPGTNYNVLVTVSEGTDAEVLEVLDGWARIRLIENDQIGWMAERLLRDI